MDTVTQTHWVERTFLKSSSRMLPTPTRPRPSHCPASACTLQFAASTRPQRGYWGSLSESYWKSGRRQAEAVGDAVHRGRRGGQALSLGFPATPLPGGPAACVGSHTANRDAEPRAVPPRGGASSGPQPRRVGGCRFPHTASWPGD